MNISSFDLNLLVAFDALLAEGSVTRAASRLGLSQPAMSNALSRLREGVGDPLFERTPHGILPTARALAMAEPVRAAMASLQHALQEPPTSGPLARTLIVAANSYAEAVLIPHVAKAINAAPQPMVLVVHGSASKTSTQAALTIDWADAVPKIGGRWSRTAVVLRDPLVCVMRRRKREAGTKLTLERFLDAEHVAVGSDRQRDPVDEAVGALGRHRRIIVQAVDFTTAAWIAAETDAVAVIPRRLAERFGVGLGLKTQSPPLTVRELVLGISWSRQVGDDQLVVWLRNRILGIGRAWKT